MDEPLRAEAAEQPLRDPLLEVQVDRRPRSGSPAILEHDRSDRRLAAPVERASRSVCRGARSVSSVAAQLGSVAGAAVERRERHIRADRARRRSRRSGSAPSSSSEHDSASRNGARVEAPPTCASARAASGSARSARFSSSWRSRASVRAPPAATCLRSASRSALSISSASASASRWRIPWRSRRSSSLVDHLRQAPELALDRLGLADEHVEHAVLDALRQHEVVTADLVGGLELAVDAAVALLDPPRVPRQVEVEQVRAMRLEVETLPRGVGGDQDPQRVLGRVGVEPPLDLLARAGRSSAP